MNKKSIIRSGIATLIGTTVLLPVVAIAQTDWLAQARWYLEEEAQNNLPDYSWVGQPMAGSLAQDASQTRRIRLQANVEYAILGACDDDCSDLDLELYSAQGTTMIDSDVEGDKFPMVTVTPTRTANYRIVTKMFACSNQPCYYAVGVFRR